MTQAHGHGLTDVGAVRDHNEDAFLVDDGLQLYVVADGMGGHKGGEIASAEAVRSVREHVAGDTGPTETEEVVETAILRACSHVFELSQTVDGKPGMGCTLAMLLAREGLVVVGQVQGVLLVGEGEDRKCL